MPGETGELGTMLDVAPTPAEMAGSPRLDQAEGDSLAAVIRGGLSKDRTYFYNGLNMRLFAVREGKWKLHVATYSQLGLKYFEDPMPLLFDVDADPGETTNASKHHPDIVVRLKELINSRQMTG